MAEPPYDLGGVELLSIWCDEESLGGDFWLEESECMGSDFRTEKLTSRDSAQVIGW